MAQFSWTYGYLYDIFMQSAIRDVQVAWGYNDHSSGLFVFLHAIFKFEMTLFKGHHKLSGINNEKTDIPFG